MIHAHEPAIINIVLTKNIKLKVPHGYMDFGLMLFIVLALHSFDTDGNSSSSSNYNNAISRTQNCSGHGEAWAEQEKNY